VEVVAIDEVVPEERVDFVKIDVQGHEAGALTGMERLLGASPDVCVFFEFWPYGLQQAGSSAEELLRFFEERGFSIFEMKGPTLQPLQNARALVDRLSPRGYTNLVASRTPLGE